MKLAAVRQVVITEELVAATEAALREAGKDGLERFVLWTGTEAGPQFVVRNIHVPPQRSYRLGSGVCVTVDGPALHGLNVWLFEHSQVLGAQVHTHPTEAYHSDTDNAFAIVTELGGVSLVVPDFCANALLAPGYAAYRLSHRGWVPAPPGLFVMA
jgi:hypothetical protein